MEWSDQGALLSVRRHGESSAIIEVFTENHGRHAGIVRGGGSRKLAPVLQPGNQLAIEWRARLEDHLGSYRVEPIVSRAAHLLDDRLALAGLNAICGLLKFALPEREPHPRLYDGAQNLLDGLKDTAGFGRTYLLWELLLLEDLGFGLDLNACARTGVREGLEYVSPRTGRAVSAAAAGDWIDKLLPYPDPDTPDGILAGLKTTGFFLEHWLAHSLGDRPLPDARGRLISVLQKEKTRRP